MSISARRLSLLIAISVALSASVDADHAWGSYHWARTANPFTLKTGDNVSSTWDAYLDEAIADWNRSGTLQLAEVTGGANPRNCRPTAGRIEACSAGYGKTGWLGVAQIWVNGSHITQATTKLNDTYFNTATYNKPEWRRLVTCQEVAHDFGLDHQDEIFDNANLGSCMDYTNNPLGPPSNEHPNNHDYDQINISYAHTDSTTTVGSALPKDMPPAMGQLDFDGPGQWGRLVRSSADGRVQTFEADFGRGHKVITHVVWADPDRDGRR